LAAIQRSTGVDRGRVAIEPALTRGSEGDGVRRLQALLCPCGYDTKRSDGDFGGGTERALRVHQAANGLSALGELEEETCRLLGMD
jgi:peptidoglycan hydrolase-like protein with peptidoglycan-binding domain